MYISLIRSQHYEAATNFSKRVGARVYRIRCVSGGYKGVYTLSVSQEGYKGMYTVGVSQEGIRVCTL